MGQFFAGASSATALETPTAASAVAADCLRKSRRSHGSMFRPLAKSAHPRLGFLLGELAVEPVDDDAVQLGRLFLLGPMSAVGDGLFLQIWHHLLHAIGR